MHVVIPTCGQTHTGPRRRKTGADRDAEADKATLRTVEVREFYFAESNINGFHF